MHIGIIETGRLTDEMAARHGKMERFFYDLFDKVDSGFTYRVYPTIDGVVPEEKGECDGYIITGSPFSVYEDIPWIHKMSDFIRRAANDGEKMLGICFGHQAVAHALGGRVEQSEKGWGVGVHDYRVTSAAPWMNGAEGEFSLLVSHKDQVIDVPPGAEVHASSEFCPNAMFSLGSNIFAMQGHPEHIRAFSTDLINLRREILGPDLTAKAEASLDRETHEVMVAEWIKRFFAH